MGNFIKQLQIFHLMHAEMVMFFTEIFLQYE